MATLNVRNLDDTTLSALKAMAIASGKRGVETYAREVLTNHAHASEKKQLKQEFLAEIDACHEMQRQKYGGPIDFDSTAFIRRMRDGEDG